MQYFAVGRCSPRYLLLCRHGKANESRNPAGQRLLTTEAQTAAWQVADRLGETLSLTHPEVHLGAAWRGSEQAVQETERILWHGVRRHDVAIPHADYCERLDPRDFWRAGRPHRRFAADLLSRLRLVAKEPRAPNALLLVGHQPHLSWVAEQILSQPVAIGHLEVVCIAVESTSRLGIWLRRNRVAWTIAPTDTRAFEAIIDKIKAKLEVAKLLGAVISGILAAALGFALALATDANKTNRLNNLPAGLPPLYLGISLLFAALAFYLGTIYAYDRLQMPPRFWGDSGRRRRRRWLPDRPPSSDVRILHANMLRIWNWLFTPATLCLVGALATFAWALIGPAVQIPAGLAALSRVPLIRWLLALPVIVWLGSATLLWFGWYRRIRPILGTED